MSNCDILQLKLYTLRIFPERLSIYKREANNTLEST